MRFPFKHITAAVVLAGTFLAPAMAPAQTDAQKAAIASLVSAYYKAAATGDGATFASLTTRKSYTFTTIKGNVLTGTEVLEKAGAARGKALAGGASNPSGSVKVTCGFTGRERHYRGRRGAGFDERSGRRRGRVDRRHPPRDPHADDRPG